MICFWVEGKTDRHFLDYYLKEQLKIQEEYKIETLYGYTQINNEEMGQDFDKRRFNGQKLVFLLDGDVKVKDKQGYNNIKNFFDENELDKIFYIEPDLEIFLLSTLKSDDPKIVCFETYEKCINKELSSKSKLYAYWEAVGLEYNKDKEKDCWKIFDFDSDQFYNLKSFLKSCFG